MQHPGLGAIKALVQQAGAPAQLTAVDNTAGTAYNYRWTGAGVTIFLPGFGIRGTHTEFTGRLGAGYDATGTGADPFTDNSQPNASFPFGHDTGTASTGMGTTFGIAKAATIYPLTMLTLAEAAAWNLARPLPIARQLSALARILAVGVPGQAVVSWSMIGSNAGDLDAAGATITSGNIASLTAAVQAIIDAGIPFVTAAGNNAGIYNVTPQNMPDVINVGNLDASTGNKSATSSFGSLLDIWAVGSGTGTNEASSTGNSATTGAYDGTSECAPIVAGTIACLLQAFPSYRSAAVWSTLLANATAVTGSVGAGSPAVLVNSLGIPDGGVGASIAPTWSQTVNGNDAWAGLTLALRPAPVARNVKLGALDVVALKLGTATVTKAYLGTVQLWP